MAAPSGNLLSSDKDVAAKISQWCAFADQEIAAPHGTVAGMIYGYIAYNKPVYTSILAMVEKRLQYLNKYLASNTFLVGDRMTLADIFVASALLGGFTGKGHLDAKFRAKIPNVVRLFETIVKNPKLAPIFGEITYVETAPQYQAPKKEGAAKKEKAEAAPKAAKAPKAPKEKKPAANDDDDDEPAAPPAPKEKNPLDDLPKSNFNLENWKRVYSNEDTRPTALNWFYENFDNEGFSVWKMDFKYNDELTQVFMSSNLIGGLFARLEASRKYLFGSVGVLGKSNDSVITGVMITRGQDIVHTMSVAPDWESYEFKKIDLANEDDKKFFEGAMAWDLEVDGKAWADGKNYK